MLLRICWKRASALQRIEARIDAKPDDRRIPIVDGSLERDQRRLLVLQAPSWSVGQVSRGQANRTASASRLSFRNSATASSR